MKPILLFLLIIITTSCYHVYYSPNTANAPLLSEKGEIRINGLYASGGSSEFGGGEIQAAAAISKNAGVMINGMFLGKTETVSNYDGSNSHEESGKGSYVEFAGGLFKHFDEKKRWIGEIYGGIGLGNATNSYEASQASKVGITKIFLQPAMGYKNPYLEFVLVPRISFISWRVKNDGLVPGSQSYNSNEMDLINIHNKPNFICFEPAFILRAGGENFKLQGALSFSNFNNDYYAVENLNASIGVSINVKSKKK